MIAKGTGLDIGTMEEHNEWLKELEREQEEFKLWKELDRRVNRIKKGMKKTEEMEEKLLKGKRLEVLDILNKKKEISMGEEGVFIRKSVMYLDELVEEYTKIEQKELLRGKMEDLKGRILITVEGLLEDIVKEYEEYIDKKVESANKDLGRLRLYLDRKKEQRRVFKKE